MPPKRRSKKADSKSPAVSNPAPVEEPANTDSALSDNDTLYGACEDGDYKAVKKLVRKGADVNYVNPNKKNKTPLMEACKCLSEPIVKFLIEKNADLNLTDTDGWNCLHWIAFKGHAKIMILLLEKGANFMQKSTSGSTPYDVATQLTSQKKTQCEFVLKQWMNKLPAKKRPKDTTEGKGNWNYSYHVPRNSTGRCSLDRTTGWDDTWETEKKETLGSTKK